MSSSLPYDFGKKTGEKTLVGGMGSGNWYRFNKKTTTGECHSVDVRYLHREGLLKPGNWFSLRWSRAGRETGSIRGEVIGDEKPERMILTYRHRSGPSGEWEEVQGARVPHLDSVQLRWGEAVVRLPWSRVRPEGGCPVRAREVFPVPPLLRSRLREPAGERDAPRLDGRRRYGRGLGGSANMMKPFPEKPKGMHWRTYERLWWEHDEADMEQLAGLREWLDRLEKK